jgi:hypothetical protein
MFLLILTCQEANDLSQIVKVLLAHNRAFVNRAKTPYRVMLSLFSLCLSVSPPWSSV